MPIFDRNQGNVCRAGWDGYSAFYHLLEVEKEFLARCQDLYAKWQSTYIEINLISSELIPTAQEMLEIHSDRESNGKEDCIARLETNREFIELQLQYIDAVKEFHHLKADLRLLCGEDFETLDRH